MAGGGREGEGEEEGEGEREGESKEGKESRKERELYMLSGSRAAALTRERHSESERDRVEDDKACRPRARCTYVDVHCH